MGIHQPRLWFLPEFNDEVTFLPDFGEKVFLSCFKIKLFEPPVVLLIDNTTPSITQPNFARWIFNVSSHRLKPAFLKVIIESTKFKLGVVYTWPSHVGSFFELPKWDGILEFLEKTWRGTSNLKRRCFIYSLAISVSSSSSPFFFSL